MSVKVRTARLSIISNTVLIIMKAVVGAMTGSVSIISEAIHSLVDLLASVIAYFAVKISDIPPDDDHPYGHEKIENISGVIEAVLVFAAAAVIIAESVKKIISGSVVNSLGLGFAVMFVSAGVNALVSRRLYRVAKEEESIALEADALHLKADVFTSLGVGVGLFLIWLTGLTFLDPLVAIVIALMILREAAGMLKNAFRPLIDTGIPKADVDKIIGIIDSHRNVCVDIHEIRTRKSGKITHVDFHLTVPDDMTVRDAHDICDRIENEIGEKIRHSKVLIHTESCGMLSRELEKRRNSKRSAFMKKMKKSFSIGRKKDKEPKNGKRK